MPSIPAPDLVSETDLQVRARAAWKQSGLTQRELAADLGVSQGTLAHAISDPSRSLTRVRRAVIERCEGTRVRGPYYVVGGP